MPKGRLMNAKERKRAHAFIAYPESISYEKLTAFLAKLGMKCAISPLHDQDVWDEHDVTDWVERHKDRKTGKLSEEDEQKKPNVGDKKKPHWHVVVWSTSQRYLMGLRKIYTPINIKQFWVDFDLAEYIRYLCHLDEPGKPHYDIEQVTSFGNLDLSPLYDQTALEKTTGLMEMLKQIEERNITNFYLLTMAIVKENDLEGFQILQERTTFLRIFMQDMREANSLAISKGYENV